MLPFWRPALGLSSMVATTSSPNSPRYYLDIDIDLTLNLAWKDRPFPGFGILILLSCLLWIFVFLTKKAYKVRVEKDQKAIRSTKWAANLAIFSQVMGDSMFNRWGTRPTWRCCRACWWRTCSTSTACLPPASVPSYGLSPSSTILQPQQLLLLR